jgi:Zn-dependent peptidase ImmA (M78 family)
MLSKVKQAARKILGRYGYSVPIDIEAIVKAEGILLQKENLEAEVSGMLVIKEKQTVIAINEKHALTRQRFTIAHEFGHYVLHKNLSNVFFDESLVFFRDQESANGTKYQEIEANNFAAELLMPEALLKKHLALKPLDAFDEADNSGICQLAQEFGVSTQALTIRLTKLGLITV